MEPTIFEPRLKNQPYLSRLKFFKFDLWTSKELARNIQKIKNIKIFYKMHAGRSRFERVFNTIPEPKTYWKLLGHPENFSFKIQLRTWWKKGIGNIGKQECRAENELQQELWQGVCRLVSIENRIYREELKESLGMNFFSPFQPEREFKVYKSCKCSQIICRRVH